MTLPALNIASALLGLVAALVLLMYIRVQERRHRSLSIRLAGLEAAVFPEEYDDNTTAEVAEVPVP